MPLRNRVTPEGEIVAHPARGTLMGNRGGRIHTDGRDLGVRRWASKQWIACRLRFRDRHRAVMGSGYTELFFLDEVTAFAAGHRPCAECRREDFRSFASLWAEVFGTPVRAPRIDAALHAERVSRNRVKVTFAAAVGDLPEGTMIRMAEGPALLLGEAALPWSPDGYGPASRPPMGEVRVLTPHPIVSLLRAGLRFGVHTSAGETRNRQGPRR